MTVKLSVGVTRNAYLLETEGLLTRGSRPPRTSGGSVGVFPNWTDLIGRGGYQNFDSRSDTEFNPVSGPPGGLKALMRFVKRVIYLDLIGWKFCSFRANSDRNSLWSLTGQWTLHHLLCP
jgi:hypothetical protein